MDMQTKVTTTGGALIDEFDRLIASDKVEGTAVFNRQDERLGAVHNFMVDKVSGHVAYAVMSFGGFLGVGVGYHPLPWRVLTYDERLQGYVIDLDREKLLKAPHYKEHAKAPWTDRTFAPGIDQYYAAIAPFGVI